MTLPTGNYKAEDLIASVLRHSDPSDWRYFERHQSLTYTQDVRLTLHLENDDPFSEPWMDVFSDKTGNKVLVTVRYGGALVEEFIFILVDGGRALLPLPGSGSIGSEPVRTITHLQKAVGAILNTARKTADVYDAALESANFKTFSGS